jgi:hypothetical protein
MQQENNKFTLTKIPLEPLIEILLKVYELGMEYIDIEGTVDEADVKDTVSIKFFNDYMNIDESDIGSIKGYIIGYNDIDDEETKPFSDDDINDLI